MASWAVAIYTDDDEMIGYISRFKNQTIARLMDAGKRFNARIDPEPENEDVKTQYQSPTEYGNVYFSVYLVEEW